MKKQIKYILVFAICVGIISYCLYNNKSHASSSEKISISGELAASIDESNYGHIKIRDLQTNEISMLEVKDSLMLANSIEDIKWLENNTLAVISHVNPSLSCLLVYNVRTQELIDERYGTFFEWANEAPSSLYYISPTPHFSEEIGPESILDFSDNTVFKTDGGISLSNLAISPNGEKIGFLSTDHQSEKIMINVISSDMLGNEEKSSWVGVSGELEWKNDDVLRISSPEYEVEFSAIDGNIVNEMRFGETSNESMTEIEDILE
ncbi:MAG: hypothetical protein K2K21_06365 [Lachnospiraceae bacterium]|nr:hypothetical protein [Lachnospiraceae bacterium]